MSGRRADLDARELPPDLAESVSVTEPFADPRRRGTTVRHRFFHHRPAVVSLVLLAVIFLFAFVGQRIWPYKAGELYGEVGQVRAGRTIGGPTLSEPKRCHGDYSEILAQRFRHGPCAPHLFGSDGSGHDMVAQTMRGSQISLSIAVLVAVFSTVIGSVVGGVAGFYRGWADSVLMRGTDLFLTIPLIAVAGALSVHVHGGGWWVLAIILGALGWMPVARIIRGEFLSLRTREFVEAARATGASSWRIIVRHMLPNATGSIVVNATLVVGAAILLETALSYLGLGVKPPDTSLGLIISENQSALQTRPWLFWIPGLIIVTVTLCINFIGDGLRDAFDPRYTRSSR
jgi:ABC-type dipeptide/oligopeptide/nickel transport system permease subunit